MTCICGKSAIILSTATVISTSVALWSTYKFIRNKFFNRSTAKDDSNIKINDLMTYHFGKRPDLLASFIWIKEDLPSFHKRCAEICGKHFVIEGSLPNRVLDLGCGVGRLSFELARFFEKVVGIDIDPACVAVGQQLKQYGRLVYSVAEEGDITSQHIAEVDPEIDRTRVHFGQEDMTNLPSSLGQFGCVVASNVLCHTKKPRELLTEAAELIVPHGMLVVATSYFIHSHGVDKKDQLGGTVLTDGSSTTGFEALQEELIDSFELLDEANIPMICRKSNRTLIMLNVHVTVWRKKNENQADQ